MAVRNSSFFSFSGLNNAQKLCYLTDFQYRPGAKIQFDADFGFEIVKLTRNDPFQGRTCFCLLNKRPVIFLEVATRIRFKTEKSEAMFTIAVLFHFC
jgi:hypothetical protein